MKKILFILLLLMFAGCGSTLRNSWTNFRAYYNTYYNAERSFRSGVAKVKELQSRQDIDVSQPLRVHPTPVKAGGQEFNRAIEKGARILRKFPDSRWMDETLALIGKSYFYLGEYYSALQKFEEQYRATESNGLKQQAVIWKGRVMLELGLYEEGISYLEEELSALRVTWDGKNWAEARVLLAEHHAQLGHWREVLGILQMAIPKLDPGPVKARSYFLFGQILEADERFGEAAFAYSMSAASRPNFELLYWAKLKQAGAFRKLGNLDQAAQIYERMRNDDKNVDRRADINYEIARTAEERGDLQEAADRYRRILRNSKVPVSQEVRADIYYRLGHLYSRHFKSYDMAAAYFDSSASFRPEDRNGVFTDEMKTETLAEAYGQYSRLRSRIQRIDSLLWLSSLPKSRLDSVIANVRRARVNTMQESRKNQDEGRRSAILNRAEDAGTGDTGSGLHGFLNYKNTARIAEERQQFIAVWGPRALVDNWRRIEAVREGEQNSEDMLSGRNDRTAGRPELSAVERGSPGLDFVDLPMTEMQKQEKREERASIKYKLGHLFLLTLGQPDSAEHYFESVIAESDDAELLPRALYSLVETCSTKKDRSCIQKWSSRLRSEFPESEFARKLNERFGILEPKREDPQHSGIRSRSSRILASDLTAEEKAESLRTLALSLKQDSDAPVIHYEAIRQFARLARQKVETAVTDSTVALPDTIYYGRYWDKVWEMIEENRVYFPGSSPVGRRVEKISEELDKLRSRPDIKSCRRLGIGPTNLREISDTMANLSLPDPHVPGKRPDSLYYEILIEPSGKVSSYTLLSGTTDKGVREAVKDVLENRLEFDTADMPELGVRVRCEIVVPFGQRVVE